MPVLDASGSVSSFGGTALCTSRTVVPQDTKYFEQTINDGEKMRVLSGYRKAQFLHELHELVRVSV